jgi:hypothetical protein
MTKIKYSADVLDENLHLLKKKNHCLAALVEDKGKTHEIRQFVKW